MADIVGRGSAKGDLNSFGPLAGESTDVASANRVLRGVDWPEDSLDSEFVRMDRVVADGPLLLASCIWKPTAFARGPLTISRGEAGRN